MSQIKELLTEMLQDLLDAETRLTQALPKMTSAANHPKLKEAFEKHLVQTQRHVERLNQSLETLGEEAQPKQCKAIAGLLAEAEETIKDAAGKAPWAADLALIAAAQKVEHYEISSYGTARTLARQIGQVECVRLLSHTLGEEESADFLLTMIADPLLQQGTLEDMGAEVDLDAVPSGTGQRPSAGRQRKGQKTERGAA